MHKSDHYELNRSYPHLAIALFLIDSQTLVMEKDVKELSVTIEQTNVQTGEVTPLKVIF